MIAYMRFLSGHERTHDSNRHLGLTLAFIAGAVNAGGYLAVSRYTSHMTGIVSAVADSLALRDFHAASTGLAAYISFLFGSATAAILINWARRTGLRSRYALPILFESILLLAFGLLGSNHALPARLLFPATVLLLCYTMGLQNAVITKVSDAEIRTTHVTGLTTDLGIELGKLLYWNLDGAENEKVLANRAKMRLHASVLALFAVGGVVGALAFKNAGFISALPISLLLFIIAAVPVWDDLTTGALSR